MQQELAQEFNRTAAAAYKAFPEALARLVVLLVPNTDIPVYISPQVVDQLTRNTAAVREAIRGIYGYFRRHNAAGVSVGNYDMVGTDINLIALDSVNILGNFSERYTKEMRALFNLDHEIGHHVLRNGFPSGGVSEQKAECAADAFAMLRHIQRFGNDTDKLGYRWESIASCIIVNGDTEHYTSDAMQNAVEIADGMGEEFFAIPLQRLANIAAHIADGNALEETTLDKIREAYRPVMEYCRAHIGDGLEVSRKLYDGDMAAKEIFCHQTLAVMRSAKYRNDPDVIRAGKRFLNSPALKDFMHGAAAVEKDNYWKKALVFIKAHAVQPPPVLPSQRP